MAIDIVSHGRVFARGSVSATLPAVTITKLSVVSTVVVDIFDWAGKILAISSLLNDKLAPSSVVITRVAPGASSRYIPLA